MILLDHPNSVLRGNNKLTVEYLNQVQKCVEKLDEMGLTVTNIHFERIKPTVRVKTCTQTKTLQKKTNKPSVLLKVTMANALTNFRCLSKASASSGEIIYIRRKYEKSNRHSHRTVVDRLR